MSLCAFHFQNDENMLENGDAKPTANTKTDIPNIVKPKAPALTAESIQPRDLLKRKLLMGEVTDVEKPSKGGIQSWDSLHNLNEASKPSNLSNCQAYSMSCDHIFLPKKESEKLEIKKARDVVRPLYRKDIFYSGSIMNLSGNQDITSHVQSMTSVPDSKAGDTETSLLGRFSTMCKSMTDTMKQMMDFSLMLNPVFAVYGLSCFLCMAGRYLFLSQVTLKTGLDYKIVLRCLHR